MKKSKIKQAEELEALAKKLLDAAKKLRAEIETENSNLKEQ